ncbi:type II toxin-antitoxin system PemK/MazF family toxin [Candidatus Electrothrix sp.]|uniref:type II toxin-antitoxin system PemK/MazF family toxin n=1 Tax=Candidatus Electrothrix sp. TaxID=2170559 RepID=UPI0040574EAC
MVIKRGQIWWAELPDPVGSGPGYRRPLLIVQSNEFNQSNINTVIAVIITTNTHLAAAPGNVLLTRKESKLNKKSVINVSQLITIDKTLCTEKVHTLSNKIMTEVDNGIKLVLKL